MPHSRCLALCALIASARNATLMRCTLGAPCKCVRWHAHVLHFGRSWQVCAMPRSCASPR
eukprot:15470795-Alexandrium_andersonii.AAC.1